MKTNLAAFPLPLLTETFVALILLWLYQYHSDWMKSWRKRDISVIWEFIFKTQEINQPRIYHVYLQQSGDTKHPRPKIHTKCVL